jgi:predicted RNA-binding protein associated with RNAse of E/G family
MQIRIDGYGLEFATPQQFVSYSISVIYMERNTPHQIYFTIGGQENSLLGNE